MKQLNIESTKTMNIMVGMAEDGYVKINNSDGSFMSVILEVILEDEKIKIISLAHYYLQEGDLMADPEMCFIYNKGQEVTGHLILNRTVLEWKRNQLKFRMARLNV